MNEILGRRNQNRKFTDESVIDFCTHWSVHYLNVLKMLQQL